MLSPGVVGVLFGFGAAAANSCIDSIRKAAAARLSMPALVALPALLEALLACGCVTLLNLGPSGGDGGSSGFGAGPPFAGVGTRDASYPSSDASLSVSNPAFSTQHLSSSGGAIGALFPAPAPSSLTLLAPWLRFAAIVAASSFLLLYSKYLYTRALTIAPMSLTVPYLSFTPAILVLIAFLFLGERPTAPGVAGVIVITLGGLLLARHPSDGGNGGGGGGGVGGSGSHKAGASGTCGSNSPDKDAHKGSAALDGISNVGAGGWGRVDALSLLLNPTSYLLNPKSSGFGLPVQYALDPDDKASKAAMWTSGALGQQVPGGLLGQQRAAQQQQQWEQQEQHDIEGGAGEQRGGMQAGSGRIEQGRREGFSARHRPTASWDVDGNNSIVLARTAKHNSDNTAQQRGQGSQQVSFGRHSHHNYHRVDINQHGVSHQCGLSHRSSCNNLQQQAQLLQIRDDAEDVGAEAVSRLGVEAGARIGALRGLWPMAAEPRQPLLMPPLGAWRGTTALWENKVTDAGGFSGRGGCAGDSAVSETVAGSRFGRRSAGGGIGEGESGGPRSLPTTGAGSGGGGARCAASIVSPAERIASPPHASQHAHGDPSGSSMGADSPLRWVPAHALRQTPPGRRNRPGVEGSGTGDSHDLGLGAGIAPAYTAVPNGAWPRSIAKADFASAQGSESGFRPALGSGFVPRLGCLGRALSQHPGSLMMLGVACLWSVTASLDKLGVMYAPSIWTYIACQRVCIALMSNAALAATTPAAYAALRTHLPALLLIAALELGAVALFFEAIKHIYVSYVVAIKRSNILLSVLIGGLFFKERILSRLPYVCLMLTGMALIILEPNAAAVHEHHN